MTVYRITKHGEKVLRRKSADVDFKSYRGKLPGLLSDMWETMYAAHGVGLAAPQIDLNLRVAIIDPRVSPAPSCW